MNPYANAALTASIPTEGNPRQSEAWALTESGRYLALASRGADANAMREALRLNWRLWTIFQADLTVALEPNETGAPTMPQDLVINMLTLCQFVDKHTVAALAEPTGEKLQVLVDLNRQIAAGLLESLANDPGVSARAPAEQEEMPPAVSIAG